MKTSTHFALPFFYLLLTSSCSNQDYYPAEYVGFEQTSLEHFFDTKNEEETITLKIIAGEKQHTDRRLTIRSSANSNAFRIQEIHPVIPKGKKSVKTNLILFPKKMNGTLRALRLVCIPEGKDAKVSEISIRLQKK
ncbi:MAG: hypothetical protein K2G02_08905 [Phocaeicola sp.]|uniref:hypothetical protein n=1 Tax=Phocaeicola sp. TaxID=2773926 RepID=UPI0023C1DF1F|nr:hypothetical protein [Phocaeicola sp.]MDE5677353.1 hypothetical protein [Phocaeicola sp.]MDE6181209.1 hypothetical protein [Phocaeicola sp.]